MTAPRVSVCVPVHNGARFLREGLESIRAQTYPLHEIILCDDASTDETPAILADAAAEDSRIRTLRNESSLGRYGALNRAARSSSGELLALYHTDGIYDRSIVEREVEYLGDHPDAGAVFTLDRLLDERGREAGRFRWPPELREVTRFFGPQLTEAVMRHKHRFLRTPSVMMRRTVFDALDGFDHERFGAWADFDLWLRLSQTHPIGVIHEHLMANPADRSTQDDRLRTSREPYFVILDRHLSRAGIHASVTTEAHTCYGVWRVKDEAERAANALLLGDRQHAVTLLNRSFVRPLLRSSSRRAVVVQILALRSLVRLAARTGAGRASRALVHLARFRRLSLSPAAAPTKNAGTTRTESSSPSRQLRVFLDPFSYHFLGNEIFNPESTLNRDGCFRPWLLLRDRLSERGIEIHTADYLVDGSRRAAVNVYTSFGIHTRFPEIAKRDDVLLNAFYLFETMMYAEEMYRKLPELSRHFRSVYSWTDATTLAPYARGDEPFTVRSFQIPMPREDVLEPHWSRTERAGIALVNANGRGTLLPGELLTERLRALRHFSSHGGIDLWGRQWDTVLEGQEPFAEAIRASWRGPIADKYEGYSRYRFVVCYENMATPGWITEKLFDCLYTGVVPIYLGAPDIGDYVWPASFIDRRDFSTYDDLSRFLDDLSPAQYERYRDAGRAYLESSAYYRFTAAAFADRFLDDIDGQLRERGIAAPWG
ncbi:MAG: glycosyltransferase [Gemmatimonadota bacterium]|nr:glycosyltransferase [Gemmatimonadota bacterium]